MKEGDCFWLHICTYKPEFRENIPVSETCKTCDWEELSDHEKNLIRQKEHRERMEQDYDY